MDSLAQVEYIAAPVGPVFRGQFHAGMQVEQAVHVGFAGRESMQPGDRRNRAARDDELIECLERRKRVWCRHDVAGSAEFHRHGTDLRFEPHRIVDQFFGIFGREFEFSAPELRAGRPGREHLLGFFAISLAEVTFGRISCRSQGENVRFKVEPKRIEFGVDQSANQFDARACGRAKRVRKLFRTGGEGSGREAESEMIGNASDMAGTLNFIIADAGRLLGQMSSGNYVIQSEDASRYTGDFEKLLVSMRLLRDQMVQTLDSIAGASEQVSAGSSNLAEGAQSLAEGATEQAGAVEELQATITSITENIQKAAEQAQESYEQAQKYADEADNSRSEMKAMVEAMERINETSQKIENIISEIEDIASQTNLLSLNASIEAARAGEAGRGFAVVADQIRQLAEQSAKAVVDTRDLIEGSLQEITEGTKAADRAAASIETVVDGIQKIAESSRQVSTVSTDQALAMRQAEQGVGQISEVVQANSATAQESSATSEELSAQAVSLDELISKFVLPN